MLYFLIIGLIISVLSLIKRQLALGTLLIILLSIVLSWWSSDLSWVFSKININLESSAIIIIEFVLLILLLLTIILKSSTRNSCLVKRILEAILLTAVLMVICQPFIDLFVPLDSFSIDAHQFVLAHHKIILTIATIYGFISFLLHRDEQ